jgi:ABC-type transporter Mla subunit MlaD
MAKVDLELALEAISADLDTQGDTIADMSGELEAVKNFLAESNDNQRETMKSVAAILRYLQEDLGPKLDRLNEVDELRGRVVALDATVRRAGMRVVPGPPGELGGE